MKPGVVLLGRRKRAVSAAKRLGLRPLVVRHGPHEDDHERAIWQRDISDREAMLELGPELLSVAPVLAVVPTTEASVVPAAYLRDSLGVRGMTVPVAEHCTDKARMKRAIRDVGLVCADWATHAEGLGRARLIERLGLPMVVKARASSGGRGTRIARTADDVPLVLGLGRMAESFVTGVEMSVETLIVDGKPVFENPTEYFRPGWANIVPAQIDAATRARVMDTVRRAIVALGIDSGIAHTEVFVRDDAVVFGELAVRAPGGYLMELIQRVYGFDPWEALLRIAIGERVDPPAAPQRAAGVWLLHPGPGRVVAIEGVAEARAMPGVVDLPFRLDVGDDVATRVGVGQEVGHVTVEGSDRDEAAARLRAAHDRVQITLSKADEE